VYLATTFVLTSWILLSLNATLQGKEKEKTLLGYKFFYAEKGQCLATRDCV